MILAVTFGDDNFSQSRDYNLKSALKYGCVDETKAYMRKDLDPSFCNANKEILTTKRGGGYWLWKPYIIEKAFEELEMGDYLVYADSGSFYKKDIHILIGYMKKNQMPIFFNQLDHKEKEYSKRDAFVYMDVDDKGFENTYQFEASFLIVEKTETTKNFLREWLQYSCDKRIISDDDNICGLKNYDGFIQNRYDQTVLSLLAKKYGFKGSRPVDMPRLRGEKNIEYPQIIVRTRYRNTNKIKFLLKIGFKHLQYYWLNLVGIEK